MSIFCEPHRILAPGWCCGLLSLLFFSQLVFPILGNRIRSRSIRWHRRICNLTQSLLYLPEKQLKFKGQFTPLTNYPSQQQLQSYDLITRCLIYPQYIRSRSLLGAFLNSTADISRARVRDPIVLSSKGIDDACLLGCINMLYEISLPKTGRKIHVSIVTDLGSRKCHEQTRWLQSTGNRNHYIARNYNVLDYGSSRPTIPDSRKRLHGKSWMFRSHQQAHSKNPINPNHCIPQQVASANSSEAQSRQTTTPYNRLICSKILQALSNRTQSSGRFTELDGSSSSVVELINVSSNSLSAATQCLLPWKDKHVLSRPSSAERSLHCVFGCIRRYFQYRTTGEIAEFLFVRNCEPDLFRPCSIDSYDTTSASRLPVSAIMNVSYPSDDRARVVRRAITELRSRPGFSNIPSDSIVETRVEKQSGSWYKVIIWLELSLLEF